MSKVLRYFFVFGALVMFISSVSVTEAKGQLTEILRRMDDNNKHLQSLKANVIMVKYDSVLKASDTSEGTTSYLPKTASRGMYARIDWTKPTEEQMSVIGDNYELYRPKLNQVYTGNVKKTQGNSKASNILGFMTMSKDQLKTNYDVSYLGDETLKSGVKTFHLNLVPKTASSYKSAELWVDKDGMPLQAKIVEQNNDTTTILLSGIEKNVTLRAEIFKLKYPSSVKKIAA